jgi:hypothetical protein
VPGVDQREHELKFELTCERLRQLDQHPALSEIAVGQPNTRTLRSIYFDTRDQRLREAGISLRVRSDGDVWVQTITVSAGSMPAMASRSLVRIVTTMAEEAQDDWHDLKKAARFWR